MISATAIAHPPSLETPSPMSSSSPSPALTSPLPLGGLQNHNANRPLLATRSSHCPTMPPLPRSQSNEPILGGVAMSSSASFPDFMSANLNPNTSHLSSVAMNMGRRPSLPASHPLLHHHHPMERQRSYDPRRQPPGFYLEQQALLQEQFEQQKTRVQSQQQVPAPLAPAPASLQRPALTPLSPSRSMSSLSSTSTMTSSLSSSSISSSFSSSTLTSVSTAVRHPLWQLDCKSCKVVLCKQAMLGHLAGDPDKKLFSTNQAIGVLGLPDRPVSILCQCKFHLFACASCGGVCGYKLVQPCAGCETTRGNGHFWIFYANEVMSHWRRIEERGNINKNDDAHAVTKTTVATALEGAIGAVAAVEMEASTTTYKESSRPSYTSTSPYAENKVSPIAGDRVEDLMMAKCQLNSVTGYGYGVEAEDTEGGRLMYWDDLPEWGSQGQSKGNVGR